MTSEGLLLLCLLTLVAFAFAQDDEGMEVDVDYEAKIIGGQAAQLGQFPYQVR